LLFYDIICTATFSIVNKKKRAAKLVKENVITLVKGSLKKHILELVR